MITGFSRVSKSASGIVIFAVLSENFTVAGAVDSTRVSCPGQESTSVNAEEASSEAIVFPYAAAIRSRYSAGDRASPVKAGAISSSMYSAVSGGIKPSDAARTSLESVSVTAFFFPSNRRHPAGNAFASFMEALTARLALSGADTDSAVIPASARLIRMASGLNRLPSDPVCGSVNRCTSVREDGLNVPFQEIAPVPSGDSETLSDGLQDARLNSAAHTNKRTQTDHEKCFFAILCNFIPLSYVIL